ncbi:hypothetical protein P9112_003490 [Eukaryota sp. TZLM1-RC]
MFQTPQQRRPPTGFGTPASVRPPPSSVFRSRAPQTPRVPQATVSLITETPNLKLSSISDVPLLVSDLHKSISSHGFIFPSASRHPSNAIVYARTSSSLMVYVLKNPHLSAILHLSSSALCSPRALPAIGTHGVEAVVVEKQGNIVSMELVHAQLCGTSVSFSKKFSSSFQSDDVPDSVLIAQSPSDNSCLIKFTSGKLGIFSFDSNSFSLFSQQTESKTFRLFRPKMSNDLLIPNIVGLSYSIETESDYYVLAENGEVHSLNQSKMTVNRVFKPQASIRSQSIAIKPTIFGPVSLSITFSNVLNLNFHYHDAVLELNESIISTALRKFQSDDMTSFKILDFSISPKAENLVLSIGSACLLVKLISSSRHLIELLPCVLPINHATDWITDQSFLIAFESSIAQLELKDLKETVRNVTIPAHSELVDVMIAAIKNLNQNGELFVTNEIQTYLSQNPLTTEEITQSFEQVVEILADSDPSYWFELGNTSSSTLASSFLKEKLKHVETVMSIYGDVVGEPAKAQMHHISDLIFGTLQLAKEPVLAGQEVVTIYRNIVTSRDTSRHHFVSERELFLSRPTKVFDLFSHFHRVMDGHQSIFDYRIMALMTSILTQGLIDHVRQRRGQFWFKPILLKELQLIYNYVSEFLKSKSNITSASPDFELFLTVIKDYTRLCAVLITLDESKRSIILEPIKSLYESSADENLRDSIESFSVDLCESFELFNYLVYFEGNDHSKCRFYISKFGNAFIESLINYLADTNQYKRLIDLYSINQARDLIEQFLIRHKHLAWPHLLKEKRFTEAVDLVIELVKDNEMSISAKKTLLSIGVMADQVNGGRSEEVKNWLTLVEIHRELLPSERFSVDVDVLVNAGLERSAEIMRQSRDLDLAASFVTLSLQAVELFSKISPGRNYLELILFVFVSLAEFDNFISFYPLHISDDEIFKIAKNSLSHFVFKNCTDSVKPNSNTIKELYNRLVAKDDRWEACFKLFFESLKD